VETITIKVPDGTRARLKRINRNVSALLREQIEVLLARDRPKSAFDQGKHLCGSMRGGPRNLSTTKDYLKRYTSRGHSRELLEKHLAENPIRKETDAQAFKVINKILRQVREEQGTRRHR
jgi:hypothetical protein